MPVSAGTYNYILAPWQWRESGDGESYWCAPRGAIAAVDLRPLAAQALRFVAEGFGLFALPASVALPNNTLYLGNDLHGAISAASNEIETRLELAPGDLSESTLLDSVWRVVTDLADATGSNRVKPLMPTVNGFLSLHLAGHSVVRSEKFDWHKHAAAPVIRDVLKETYRQAYRNARPEHHRRVLDMMAEKYTQMGLQHWSELIPSGFMAQEPLPHETTITDNFDRADSTALDSSSEGWDWSEVEADWQIVSNRLRPEPATLSFARAESDLSSDDHYSQAVMYRVSALNDNVYPGVVARFDTSTTTGYVFGNRAGGTTNARRLYKYVSGTQTILASGNGVAASGSTLKIVAEGSSVEGFTDEVPLLSVTDTSITGNLRTGLAQILAFGGTTEYEFDDFEAGDLAAAAFLAGARFLMPGAQIYQPRGL